MSIDAHKRGAVVAALVIALCAALAVPAAAQSSEEARLSQTQARLAQVRSELEAAKSQQSQSAASFAQAERQLAVVMEALNAAEQALDRQQQAVDAAKQRLADLEQALVSQQEALTERAVRLYKQGSLVPVGSVLTSDSPQEAMRRTALVDVINRADVRTIERVDITSTAVEAQRKQLKVEQDALERVAEQKREIAAEAESLRDERALQLAAASDRVEALAGQETHLASESRQLAALARRAERAAAAARARAEEAAAAQPATPVDSSPPTAGGGGWVWPARGPVTSGYGYRWGRMHEGIDIGAPTGTPIYAAKAGTVSYAGTMGGYGNIVLIDHGGGIVTAYAHQSQILVGVGTRVSAGQQIGKVGSTGQSTGPHLHFEVRVGGSPRDPMGYLG